MAEFLAGDVVCGELWETSSELFCAVVLCSRLHFYCFVLYWAVLCCLNVLCCHVVFCYGMSFGFYCLGMCSVDLRCVVGSCCIVMFCSLYCGVYCLSLIHI